MLILKGLNFFIGVNKFFMGRDKFLCSRVKK